MNSATKLALVGGAWQAEPRRHNAPWIESICGDLLSRFPDLDEYVCSCGVSPSGTVHAGNLRDVLTAWFVVEGLRAMGKRAKLVMFWDNLDRFRSVPEGLPASYNQYLGMPLVDVPDPDGHYTSFAHNIQADFEEVLTTLGIEAEYRDQAKSYRNGIHDAKILSALRQRRDIAGVLYSFKNEERMRAAGITRGSFIDGYYPVSVYSRYTGKDNTAILSFDGDSTLAYRCLDTGKEDSVDLRQDRLAKLGWKIDWAMRWAQEGVIFEPGGHDHASPGGSFDVARLLSSRIFQFRPPVFTEYKFVSQGKNQVKMSSSRGHTITPRDLLDIYPPSMVRWFYLRQPPHKAFYLSLGNRVFDEYKRYDSKVAERSIERYQIHPASRDSTRIRATSRPVPFRQLVAFGRIVNWDFNSLKRLHKKHGVGYLSDSMRDRFYNARNWSSRNPSTSDYLFRNERNTSYAESLEPPSIRSISQLKKGIIALFESEGALPPGELERMLYRQASMNHSSEVTLNDHQRHFFKHLYNLLISQDSGPRLTTLLQLAGRERLTNLLNV